MADEEKLLPPRLSARLHLGVSPFDPADITERVGLQPTQARRLGDLAHPGTRSPLIQRRDEWVVRVLPREALDLGEVLDELREMLQPGWERLVAECAKGDLAPVVACVVDCTPDQTPIVNLGPRTISWIHNLGATLDIDIYTP